MSGENERTILFHGTDSSGKPRQPEQIVLSQKEFDVVKNVLEGVEPDEDGITRIPFSGSNRIHEILGEYHFAQHRALPVREDLFSLTYDQFCDLLGWPKD